MTLTETMIATAIMMTVTGGVFTLLSPAQGTFQAQIDAADRLQRLRVGVEAIAKDLMQAEAVWSSGPDAIGLRFELSDGEAVTRTYYLGAGTLMRRDGSYAGLPVVDDVTGLAFEYFPDEQLCVRRVRVSLRVQDEELRFDVAPRNLTGDPATCSSLP